MATFNAFSRRNTLKFMLSVFGSGVCLGLARRLAAMTAPGLVDFSGDVRVNGSAGGGAVQPGDRVTTGGDGNAVLMIGNDVYLLRPDSDVIFPAEGVVERVLTVVSGRLMGVFGRQSLRLETPVATIGIRGTGAYMEVSAERTYFCLCYGTAELRSRVDPGYVENLATFHHDAPRNLYAASADMGGVMMAPADMVNHMDEELIMLEALAERIPLFGPKPIKMPGK